MNVQQLINELEKAGDQTAIVCAGDGTGLTIFPDSVIDRGVLAELRQARHHHR